MSRADVPFRRFAGNMIVVHTVTYFLAGMLAYSAMDYESRFLEPPLSHLMRPTSDAWVMLGPALQPIRGLIFALALFPFRTVFLNRRNGWLLLWWLLVALGILSTFGPAPGSVEGLIYTKLPVVEQLVGLWEVVLQSFLLSLLFHYWCNHPDHRWLGKVLWLFFIFVMIIPILGLMAGRLSV
jgi:hypothetical protein